jgi:hypothetical protein
MGYRKFSRQELSDIGQLILSNSLSYPQIAARYGVGRDRIMSIARKLGVVRPRGSASPFHPKRRAAEPGHGGN